MQGKGRQRNGVNPSLCRFVRKRIGLYCKDHRGVVLVSITSKVWWILNSAGHLVLEQGVRVRIKSVSDLANVVSITCPYDRPCCRGFSTALWERRWKPSTLCRIDWPLINISGESAKLMSKPTRDSVRNVRLYAHRYQWQGCTRGKVRLRANAKSAEPLRFDQMNHMTIRADPVWEDQIVRQASLRPNKWRTGWRPEPLQTRKQDGRLTVLVILERRENGLILWRAQRRTWRGRKWRPKKRMWAR